MDESNPRAKTAANVVDKMFQDGLCDLLPVLYEAATILASIPATSCTAERSFSGLRRVKTYLRSTMGEERLNSIAVINIERAYANRTIKNDMVKIIDTF
ncbi:zinc finger MYM-type 1-like, partial [Paramuricea clavata]